MLKKDEGSVGGKVEVGTINKNYTPIIIGVFVLVALIISIIGIITS